MRSALSMMIRRFLGVLGLIPAVSDKIDQVADSAIDRLEAAIPAVKQIDEMLGQTSQRSDSTATASGNGMGQEAFNQQVLQSDLPVLVDFWRRGVVLAKRYRQLSTSLPKHMLAKSMSSKSTSTKT